MASETLSLTPNASDFEDFGDEIVVIDTEQGTFFSLKGRAIPLWRAVAKGLEIEAVDQWMASLSDSAEKALVGSIMDRFLEGGLWQRGQAEEAEKPVSVLESETFGPASFEANDDFEELIRLDPIHDITDQGWLGSADPASNEKESPEN